MKHCKQLVAAVLAATLLLALCGCGAQVANVSVKEDGSGSITAFVGSTKEALEELAAYAGDEAEPLDLNSLEEFQHGGNTYYGHKLERAFSSPARVRMASCPLRTGRNWISVTSSWRS